MNVPVVVYLLIELIQAVTIHDCTCTSLLCQVHDCILYMYIIIIELIQVHVCPVTIMNYVALSFVEKEREIVLFSEVQYLLELHRKLIMLRDVLYCVPIS